MDGRPVSGEKSIHEMHGRTPWKPLPTMEIPPIHGWEGSMSGMQQLRGYVATWLRGYVAVCGCRAAWPAARDSSIRRVLLVVRRGPPDNERTICPNGPGIFPQGPGILPHRTACMQIIVLRFDQVRIAQRWVLCC